MKHNRIEGPLLATTLTLASGGGAEAGNKDLGHADVAGGNTITIQHKQEERSDAGKIHISSMAILARIDKIVSSRNASDIGGMAKEIQDLDNQVDTLLKIQKSSDVNKYLSDPEWYLKEMGHWVSHWDSAVNGPDVDLVNRIRQVVNYIDGSEELDVTLRGHYATQLRHIAKKMDDYRPPCLPYGCYKVKE